MSGVRRISRVKGVAGEELEGVGGVGGQGFGVKMSQLSISFARSPPSQFRVEGLGFRV